MSAPPKQQTSPASAPHIPVSALEPSVPGDGDQLGGSLGPGSISCPPRGTARGPSPRSGSSHGTLTPPPV